ncbi:MAG: hypothetical protein AAGJ28_06945 [Pseudomonadota bacterium]
MSMDSAPFGVLNGSVSDRPIPGIGDRAVQGGTGSDQQCQGSGVQWFRVTESKMSQIRVTCIVFEPDGFGLFDGVGSVQTAIDRSTARG